MTVEEAAALYVVLDAAADEPLVVELVAAAEMIT